MKKKRTLFKFFILFSVIIISIFLSLKLVTFLAEEFFFDKVIYQKLPQYGYILPSKYGWDWQNKVYGERNRDTVGLKQTMEHGSTPETKMVLGENTDKVYRIAVFGDSYVWGQGLTNQQRFVNILEKKLSRIRSVKIYSFALPGDSIFDNYIKYQQTEALAEKYDLVIIGLVNNDLIFSSEDKYQPAEANKIENWCPIGNIALDSDTNKISYITQVENSFNYLSRNYCAFQHLLPLLPKEKIIYYNFDDFRYSWKILDLFTQNLKSAGLTVLSPKPYYELHKDQYWTIFKNTFQQKFYVS